VSRRHAVDVQTWRPDGRFKAGDCKGQDYFGLTELLRGIQPSVDDLEEAFDGPLHRGRRIQTCVGGLTECICCP